MLCPVPSRLLVLVLLPEHIRFPTAALSISSACPLGTELSLHCVTQVCFPGILREDGTIQNELSCQRLAEVALAYAKAGGERWQ